MDNNEDNKDDLLKYTIKNNEKITITAKKPEIYTFGSYIFTNKYDYIFFMNSLLFQE